jgi:hypothetical protein
MLYDLKTLRSRSASAENPGALPGEGGRSQGGRKGSPCIEPLAAGDVVTLLDVDGPGQVRRIWCTIPPDSIEHNRNLILRAYWDGSDLPSVEVPLTDFFGVSHGRQRHLVTELVGMQEGRGFNCRIPMPFARHARITIENDSGSDVAMFFYQIDFTLGDAVEGAGYLHAQFRREDPVPYGVDYTILDGATGPGVYLGTVLGIRNRYDDVTEWWGEGEVKFFLDGETYPTICGTGLEDYIGSAWGTGEVCTPTQGAPFLDEENGLYSLYRFHTFDPIYFRSDLRVTVQQIGAGSRAKAAQVFGENAITYRAVGTEPGSDLGLFERSDDYSSVAFWYQQAPNPQWPALPGREERTHNLTPDRVPIENK